MWLTAPGVTVKVSASCRPPSVAVIVTGPARTPVTVSVTTPEAPVVGLVRPLTVPVPADLVKKTCSPETGLPAASVTVAVTPRVAPDARLALLPLTTSDDAEPATTVKVRVLVRPPSVARTVTDPAPRPVRVSLAMPEPSEVGLVKPVTDPDPADWLNTTVSPWTGLLLASVTVAVTIRVLPDVRGVVAPARLMWAAGPATIENDRASCKPPRVAVIVAGPAPMPVTVSVTIPDAPVVGLVRPVTVPEPADLVNTIVWPDTALPAASVRVAVTSRVEPDARLLLLPLTVRWAATPATIVKVRSLLVTPPSLASIVIEPTRVALMMSVATPDPLVIALVNPLTVPVPVVLPKTTVWPEMGLLAASVSVAVSVRF